MNQTTDKYLLYRWIGWFFLTTSIILFLTQLSYIKYMPNLHEIHGATHSLVIFTWLFLFASYITQTALLAFGVSLLPLLIAWIIRKRTQKPRFLVFSTAITLAAALSIGTAIEIIVYAIYHSHEMAIGMSVIKTGALTQVMPISLKEILALLGIITGFILLYTTLAILLWRFLKKKSTHRSGYWISGLLVVIFCFSYGMMSTVVTLPKKNQLNETASLLLLKAATLVPYYSELYSLIMPVHNKYMRTIQMPGGPLHYQTHQPNYPLQYPLHPLQCSPNKTLPNILFIVVDTWRYDALNAKITPNLYRFSKKTLQFKNEWSGGNCTQTGVFSLFYGIPVNFWEATLEQHQGPVLINQLLKQHYEMAIYASATLQFPAFNKNVFHAIKNLKTETKGNTTVKRDKAITQEFHNFLNKRNKNRPFFGFLFYDAAHNYCAGGKTEHQTPFQPAIKECARFMLTKNSNPTPYIDRYHNAVHFIDAEIGQALKQLKKHHLYKNTIIIITADHGEQFNDEKLGYWSHTSTYSQYQLHVPLLVYWPGKKPRIIPYFTSHYDIVPTLLTKVFHCRNPIKDYSTGKQLFNKNRKPYLITGNYTSYAVLTKDRITRINPNGAYTLRYPNGHQIPNAIMNRKIMNKAYEELNRYYIR